VISVGLTTVEDTLSDRSGRGPSFLGGISPTLVAPGELVRSAFNLADDSYAVLSAASMSASHVTGVVAILKAQDPDLPFKKVVEHLGAGAYRGLPPDGQDCGGVSDSVFPNNAVGHGRVDAYGALLSLLNLEPHA
jgi:subtilisin family serine protease